MFSKRDIYYKNILYSIADGVSTVKDISEKLNRVKGGDISERLHELSLDGFVERNHTWNIATQQQSKHSRYRIIDNYLRFYIKHVMPHKHQIELGMQKLPTSWETILGFQFENLVISNRERLHQLLHIDPKDIVYANPFLQTKTLRQEGCQFDYLIQTKYNTLIACEMKFRKREVDTSVVKSMQQKISKLKIPRGFSIKPILIHVNGVSDPVINSDYFVKIIDFSDFLRH